VSAVVTQTRPTLLMLSLDVTVDIAPPLVGCPSFDRRRAGNSSGDGSHLTGPSVV
jgi:hypothetical protein